MNKKIVFSIKHDCYAYILNKQTVQEKVGLLEGSIENITP